MKIKPQVMTISVGLILLGGYAIWAGVIEIAIGCVTALAALSMKIVEGD